MRRPAGGNAFSNYASKGRRVHKLQANYYDIPIGGYMRVRFLDLTPETEEGGAVVIPGFRVKITNPQNNQLMGVVVHGVYENPEDPIEERVLTEEFQELVDHENNPLSAGQPVYVYRTPVWVYEKMEDSKKLMEEIDALRYLEFTQGLRDSMDEVAANTNGKYILNEETGLPDYDMNLVIIKGEGSIPKNYRFEGLDWDAKKKQNHVNFGVDFDDWKKDYEDDIDKLWDEVMEAAKTTMTIEEVRKQVTPRSGGGGSVSSRPDLRRGDNDEDQGGDADKGGDDRGSDRGGRGTRGGAASGRGTAKEEAPSGGRSSGRYRGGDDDKGSDKGSDKGDDKGTGTGRRGYRPRD